MGSWVTALNPLYAIIAFHSPLVLHWFLVRSTSLKFRYYITLFIIGLLFALSLSIKTTDFLTSYCRVMACLFAMQLIRMVSNPRTDYLNSARLKDYLLSIMSFGEVATPGALANTKDNQITLHNFAFSTAVLFMKYAIVHLIHIFLAYYPYPRDPPLRQFVPFSLQAWVTYYLISIQLYMYMSIYFALSFGLYAFLCGRTAPQIFHAPLAAASPRDFWSRRWNMMFKQGLHDTIFVPVLQLLRASTHRTYVIQSSNKAIVSDAPADTKKTDGDVSNGQSSNVCIIA